MKEYQRLAEETEKGKYRCENNVSDCIISMNSLLKDSGAIEEALEM
jgi:hypothetical protein